MILIDGRYIVPQMSGIGRYTLNLLHGLVTVGRGAALPGLGPVGVWVSPDAVLPPEIAESPTLRVIPKAGRPQQLGNWWRNGSELRQMGVSVMHCPDTFAPRLRRSAACRVVLTVHDVIPLVCQGQLNRSVKQRLGPAWRWWVAAQVRQASAVVTVSEYSAQDLRQVLGLPDEKITVIPNAIPPSEQAMHDGGDEVQLARLGVRSPFALYVGRRDPYKNVPGLVRAFARLHRHGEAGSNHLANADATAPQLVIAGEADPRYREAEQEACRLGLGHNVVFTDYVDQLALSALYRQASLVVSFSRYEGFGLPLLEAMRAGTPVVATRAASIPEVLSGAGLLVEVDDEAGLAAAMGRVLSDAALRDRMVAVGRIRAQQFTVERLADAHIALYRQMMGSRPQ